jgi:hypothetical protein
MQAQDRTGLSDEHYSHSEDQPIYGTGQGSGNSPMIWCFLSSALFDCYDNQAHGASYATPDKRYGMQLHMVGYVDDSNGQTNMFDENQQPNHNEILDRAKADAQLWHDLLHTSGGALELIEMRVSAYSLAISRERSPYTTNGGSRNTK